MVLPVKKSETTNIRYEFKKISGRLINYREAKNRPACVSYQTILIRGMDGQDYLLRNVNVSHKIDPYLRATTGLITVVYVHGQGNGQKDEPFAFLAGIVTASGNSYFDFDSLYTFSRGVRAQLRLPYLEILKGGVALCVIFIGLPIVFYAGWKLLHLGTPLLTADFSRLQIRDLDVTLD